MGTRDHYERGPGDDGVREEGCRFRGQGFEQCGRQAGEQAGNVPSFRHYDPVYRRAAAGV
ncbi:hypothetical protein D3C73_1636610 [compost metagenome]